MRRYSTLLLLLFFVFFSQAQQPSIFTDEVKAIQKKYDTIWDASKETIVFTGSSSIRIWNDLQERFPQHQIVNSGFGGSQAKDLLQFLNELVLHYQPKKVFIYEGDNDVAAKKKVKQIVADMETIISKIQNQNPTIKIMLIAAKPSLARWNFRGRYKRLNKKFKKLSNQDARITFIDVWKPMLNGRKVKPDIFISDGLHMNAKGYAIWYDVIRNYLEN